MTSLVGFEGLLIVGLGAVGSLRPNVIIRAVLGWEPRTRWLVALGLRLAFGVVLLLGAAGTRFPTALSVLGGIALVAAMALMLLGTQRTDRLVSWWFGRPEPLIRAWLLVAVLFGCFLIYSAL